MEFFEPTLTENTLRARCTGQTASIGWSFDGSRTTVDALSFADEPLGDAALSQVNRYVAEIEGNVLFSLRCSRAGMAISLFEGDSPAASLGKKTLLNIVDGEVRLIGRYNFD